MKRLQIKITDTGNATERSEVAELSAEVDLSALKAYRLAVGLRTREVVKKLQIEDMITLQKRRDQNGPVSTLLKREIC
jgi:hypothetical protein